MTKLTDIYNSPDGGVSSAKGYLAKLFRMLQKSAGVTLDQQNVLMDQWLRDPANGIPDNSSSQSSARGNIRKEIERNHMTWRVFIKLLKWLRPDTIQFTVRLTWKYGKEVEETIFLTNEQMAKIKELPELDEMNEEEFERELKYRGIKLKRE